ncbi:hypothetical protein SRCM100730_02728 [Bacillus velezensis]|nr:hypothetical protein SRCM100731_03990 [Bacillus velezensis]OCB95837.1 hypothetical protein SRCM100730_02728 [Bacillus velezensis]
MKKFFLSKTYIFSSLIILLLFSLQLNKDGIQAVTIVNLILVSLVSSSLVTLITRLFRNKTKTA